MRVARISVPIAVLALLALLALTGPGCSDREAPESGTETTAAPESAPSIVIPDEDIAGLEALGYVDRAPTDNPEERGVTQEAQPDQNAEGVNLYGSRDRAEVMITDMTGEVLHRWRAGRRESWMHVEPLADGTLLTITRDMHIAKYDWGSQRLWRRPMRAHHDLAVRDDGHILVLVRGRTSLTYQGSQMPILCDSVVTLSPEGEVLETHPLLPLLREHLDGDRLGRVRARFDEGLARNLVLAAGGGGDMLHTNSITILEHEIEGVAPAGSILLSFRTLSRVAILAADFSELLWIWGRRNLDGQHDATQLDNGNLLIFDNGLKRGGRSRVVEVDVRQEEVVWSYEEDLYTRLRGGAQGLSNGNVLITESDTGRVLEVTREGEKVWEFWNPDVRGTGSGAQRATIYRLNRFPATLFPQLFTTE
jgi:hypothetical protein